MREMAADCLAGLLVLRLLHVSDQAIDRPTTMPYLNEPTNSDRNKSFSLEIFSVEAKYAWEISCFKISLMTSTPISYRNRRVFEGVGQ